MIQFSRGRLAIIIPLQADWVSSLSSPPASPERAQTRDGGLGKGDARILGSGEFVSETLQAEGKLEKKYLPKRSIQALIEFVANQTRIPPELICSGSRKPRISNAGAIIAHMAVEETGHAATDVAAYLGIKQTSVLQSVKKGRILSAGFGQDV